MQLQSSEEAGYPTVAASPLLNREAQAAANRWLAQFAPMLNGAADLGAEETRQRLDLVVALKPEGQLALQNLRSQATQWEVPLIRTLTSAVAELEATENDLRQRLAALAPGDPEGQVNLGALQARLAEKAAEREVSTWVPQDPLAPHTLELQTSPPSWGSAAVLGLFGLGWSAFTTLHAFFMIGGFWHVAGPFALLLLLFYSLFWAVGLGMIATAVMSACNEEILVEGRQITVRRTLFGHTWKREYTVADGTQAHLTGGAVGSRSEMRPGVNSTTQVAITDVSGKEVRFASGRPTYEQTQLMAKLNQYLGVSPH